MKDNEEYLLANSKRIVTTYLRGPLDAAAWDMGTVFEDQLDGSHKNVTVSSDAVEDADVSSGTEAVSRVIERNSEEFHKANSGFGKTWDGRPVQKGFGSFGRIGTMYQEVTVPLDDHGGCRPAFDREVDTAEWVPPAVDACRADKDVYDADDLATLRRRSRVDAGWICPRSIENSVGRILLEFPVESREVMVGCVGVPEVDDGFQEQNFFRSVADVNVCSVSSPDARTNSDMTMQSTDMMEDVVPTLHGGCTSLQLDFECSDCWVSLFTSVWRPSHAIRIYTWKSSLRRFQTFREVFSGELVKIACRMVWDAIT